MVAGIVLPIRATRSAPGSPKPGLPLATSRSRRARLDHDHRTVQALLGGGAGEGHRAARLHQCGITRGKCVRPGDPHPGYGDGLRVTSRTMLVPMKVRILSRGASISRCLSSSFVPETFAAMAFAFASSSAL
jgi:hypothetical protein